MCSMCAVQSSSVRNFSTEVTNLEFIDTLWRYSTRLVFDVLFSSGTMVSSKSRGNRNFLLTAETRRKYLFRRW